MYDRIRERPSLHRLYADQLIEAEVLSAGAVDRMEEDVLKRMEAAYDQVRNSASYFRYSVVTSDSRVGLLQTSRKYLQYCLIFSVTNIS